jgi:hypothetical protein
MSEYTFSRFVYLDTNIVSEIVKNEQIWSRFFEYLRDAGLTLGMGGGQISELSDAKSLLTDLARFLISVPTGLIKNWDEIIAEEVTSHPSMRTESLLMYPLNAILLENDGFSKLIRFLKSKGLTDARNDQLKHAKKMKDQHASLKSNFPPAKSGKYDKRQADEFAQAMVIQWLAFDHRQFLKEMQQDISSFELGVFQSIRLYAYTLFYKYYLGQREPNKLSDFGDLFHLFAIPYCELVVMERDLANILNQIKNNQKILESTEILDIDFLRRFEKNR